MASRSKTNRPKRFDKVHQQSRMDAGEQPNGYVLYIDWENRDVCVQFHTNTGKTVRGFGLEHFDLDDFYGTFSPSFGGIWMLEV